MIHGDSSSCHTLVVYTVDKKHLALVDSNIMCFLHIRRRLQSMVFFHPVAPGLIQLARGHGFLHKQIHPKVLPWSLCNQLKATSIRISLLWFIKA